MTFTSLGGQSAGFSFTDNFGEWFGNLTQQFVLDPQEEGGFVAYSNEYPGAIGQGETEEEALRDLQEAIDLLKEVLEQDKKQR
jgi:predicted RNase H-like HicB family nuclease